MKKAAVVHHTFNAILFGVILVIGTPIALAYFAYQWAADAISDSSSLSFDAECRGRVIGADDSMTKFIFYGEGRELRSKYNELCIMDINNGPVVFYNHPPGYKNKQSLGTYLNLESRFTALPAELSAPFKDAILPRFQFSPDGLVILRGIYSDRIEAAVVAYADLGLSSGAFSHWPQDAFAGFTEGANVNFSKVYHDDNEYDVSVTAGNVDLASFKLRLGEDLKRGLVVGNHVLIAVDGDVSIYDFSGAKAGDDFCCVDRIRLMPGNPSWLLSEGEQVRAWKLDELGL